MGSAKAGRRFIVQAGVSLGVGVVLLAFARPSLAQPQTEPAPAATPIAAAPYIPAQTDPQQQQMARLNLGVGLYNSGWYNCYYFYPYYACDTGSYTSYVPFTIGAQADVHISGTSFISPGFTVMTGDVNASYYNGPIQYTNTAHETLWEPSLDYVGKFGPFYEDVVARFRLGGGLYFGSDGYFGGVFRVGGGASFFATHRVGLGLDFVFEGGSYHSSWIGGLQMLVSPEFRF
jgi:hypothetical protein